jgi:NarL family two-component system response regulator LiaR
MIKPSRINVIIVDDHAVVRGGLRLFLLAFEDLELVGEAGNGKQALELCAKLEPDVVLMDLVMPGMDGVQATQAIRERYPQIQVIALTSFEEEELVQAALESGAISYLLKNVSAGELAAAIRAAHAGRATLAPEAAQALIHSTQVARLGRELTDREREVLALLIEGLSNAEIAARLVISQSTAKFHVSSILSKLEVGSRAEAVSLALQHHLIDRPRLGGDAEDIG